MNDNSELKKILGTIKIITIQDNVKRRRFFSNQFMDFEFEYVIDLDFTTTYLEYKNVSDLPNSLFDEYDLDKNYCSRWSKGQLGCFATEKQILRKFQHSGEGNLSIFLDDAVLYKNWHIHLVNAYRSLPSDWDILILGTRLGNESSRLIRPLIHWKRNLEKILFQKPIICTFKFNKYLDKRTGSVNGIFAAIYSKNGLNKLIKEPEKLRKDQDDVLISRLLENNYLNVFISYPQIVKEGVYEGSLTQKNVFS